MSTPILHNENFDSFSKQTITELFQEIAQRKGEAIVAQQEECVLTYTALDQMSDQVAYWLLQQGMEGKVIGVCLPRSLEVMVSIYGILKAGAIYLPIDPGNPPNRIRFIAQDAHLAGLITQDGHLEALAMLPVWDIHCLITAPDNPPVALPQIKPTQSAYIMYTSGSTGQPKGVAIRHNQVVAMVRNFQGNLLGYREEDIFLGFSSLNFSNSIVEIFTVTLLGAKLVIATEEQKKDPERLLDLLERTEVTYINIPPAFLAYCPYRELPKLRKIVVAGETAQSHTLDTWLKQKQVISAYGFTENTVIVSAGIVEQGRSFRDVGWPVGGVSCYLLDENKQPVSEGEVGELYVGGYQLAEGYLNLPALNEERFIDNPFVSAEDKEIGVNTRLFQTGDLMRRTPEGRLIFIGRSDFQVKINGIRIELNEIEAVLKQHPDVQQAIVIAVEQNGHKRLVAYVQGMNDRNRTIPALHQLLRAQLPTYMIPTTLIPLDRFPLNLNGKIDRSQLPSPNEEADLTEVSTWQSKTERLLAEQWIMLLGNRPLQTDSHFMQEGGDSIAFMQLTLQLNQLFELNLKVTDLYTHPTLGEQAAWIEQCLKTNRRSIKIPQADRTKPLPLSPTQRSLWIQCARSQEAQDAYNQPYLMRLGTTLDAKRWEQAWNRLIEQQEAMRTYFVLDPSGEPFMRIKPYTFQPLQLIKLHQADLQTAFASEACYHFKLYQEPPYRIQLYQEIESGIYYCYVVMHHLLIDGWSCEQVLDRKLRQFYLHPNQAAPLTYQYADYAYWKQQMTQSATDDFWLDYLQDREELRLPTKLGLSLSATHYQGAVCTLPLHKQLREKLLHFCQETACTPFSLGLATYMLLLRKFGGQAEFSVGFPYADREQAVFQEVIGYFVYMLPIRFKASYEMLSFSAYLHLVEEDMKRLIEQAIPLDQLTQVLHRRQPDAAPVMQTSFSTENAVLFEGWKQRTTSTFPLAFTWLRGESQDQLLIEYMTDLFDANWIQQIGEGFLVLFDEVCSHPDRTLAELQPYGADYVARLIEANQLSNRPTLQAQSVIDLWQMTVKSYASQTAYRYQGISSSYQQVEEESDRLAEAIRRRIPSASNRRIALCLKEKHWAPTAIWGILKAGCCYVPIDPTLPAARKHFMLVDSEASLLISDTAEGIDELPGLSVADLAAEPLSCSIKPTKVASADLAYIIYTSGTTGQPKGIPITHANLLHFVCTLQEIYQFGPDSRVLQFANLSFDASVEEFFIPLTHGAQLVLPTEEERKDPQRLFALLQAEAVSCLPIAPAMLSMLPRQSLPALRQIIVGGESTPAATLAYWSRHYTLYNTYGPTENTVDTTCTRITPESPANDIGSLLPGVSGYLLDESGRLVPEGAIGELCVGGEQLTTGYLHAQTQTQAHFMANPYQSETDRNRGRNAILYRTGDLVVRRPDNHLLFLGRKDDQMKIRGFRIELGEIERILQDCPAVHQAIVRPYRQDHHLHLAAYLQPQSGTTLCFEEIRQLLLKRLPAYMIPAFWAQIDSLPLNHSGKLNSSALPQPQRLTQSLSTDAQPTTMEEEIVATIACELLHVEQVGIQTNLFDLGLSSIQAMILVAEATRKGIETSVAALYRYRTIHQLLSHRTQNPDCFWHNKPEKGKPVLLVVSGYAHFYMVYQAFAEVMSPYFSILVMESYHSQLYHQEDCSLSHLLDIYMDLLRPILQEHTIAACTGLCLGGELAMQLANRLADEGIKPLPKVFVIDGFTDTAEAGTIEAVEADYQSPELTAEMTRITNALSQSILFRPYPGEVHLMRATQFSAELAETLDVPYARFANNEANWRKSQPGCFIHDIHATHLEIINQAHSEEMLSVFLANLVE